MWIHENLAAMKQSTKDCINVTVKIYEVNLLTEEVKWQIVCGNRSLTVVFSSCNCFIYYWQRIVPISQRNHFIFFLECKKILLLTIRLSKILNSVKYYLRLLPEMIFTAALELKLIMEISLSTLLSGKMRFTYKLPVDITPKC